MITEGKVPNAQTREAMVEVDEMVKLRRARFERADGLIADLEEATGQPGPPPPVRR